MHIYLYVADLNRFGKLAQLILNVRLGESQCSVSWVNALFIYVGLMQTIHKNSANTSS